MDLLWRVTSSILMNGRSHSVRCAFDVENDRLIIHDDASACERRRIVGWSRLGRAFVSPEMRERQDAAITARDIYTLRKDAGATIHRACERIRIISQDADSARSMHVLWSSKVFTSGERVAVTYGPRAPFREGMTMLVKVSSAVTPWMRHLRHFFPFITEDPGLWEDVAVARNLGTAHHAVETPLRDQHLACGIPSPLANVVSPLHILDAATGQPIIGGGGGADGAVTNNNNNNNNNNHNNSINNDVLLLEDLEDDLSPSPAGGGARAVSSASAAASSTSRQPSTTRGVISTGGGGAMTMIVSASHDGNGGLAAPCCACSRRLPPSLVVFVESCGDVVCVECASACARHYAEVATATTYGCPCPAADCAETLAPHELRPLLGVHEWDALEVNEMRVAVESGITCPACRIVFDGVKVDTVAGDPLADRFVCCVCDTSFCVNCGVHPFHEGRPCRDVAQKGQPACRYCANPAAAVAPTPVCADPACVEKSARSCAVSKPCGHPCYGTRGEHTCCACLTPGCPMRESGGGGGGGGGGAVAGSGAAGSGCCGGVDAVDADDFCTICYVESLGEAPCLELACGHIFHAHCLEARLRHKWPTAAVSYRFLECPLCTRPIAHPLLAPILAPLQKARDALESRYVERLRIEGLLDHPAITAPGGDYYNAPVSWARQNLTYFECFHCQKPYFGGLRRCGAAAQIDDGDDNFDRGGGGGFGGGDDDEVNDPEIENPPRDQLVCAACALRNQMAASSGDGQQQQMICRDHGTLFLEFKCKYCCNLAVWFCWGTTHFCDACHNPPRKTVRMECPGEEHCPIEGRHPPNGTEFLLGCAVCRSKKSGSATSNNNNNNNDRNRAGGGAASTA